VRGRLGRASLAATLLCTLLLPAAGSVAGPDDELQETEERLEELRDEIDAEQAEAGSLKDRIDILSGQISDLHREIARLDADIARVQAEVRTAEAQIARTQKRIDGVAERARDQAVALYKAGTTETLNALLNSKTIAELDARIEMLDLAAQENTDALVAYGRLKEEMQRQARALFDKREQLSGIRSQRAEVVATLEDRENQLAADLASLENEIVSHKNQEGNLEDRAAELRDDILAAQAPTVVPAGPVANVQPSGPSGSGFIWPLNGPVTSGYGYRWGRMHTGLDIDGYTGQGIVASKSGRVILASSYSGYGNTVIIDHGGGISTLYGHMSAFAVSRGQSVAQGQRVGSVGCTGSCTGDHLHFEVRVNGRPVNPLGYLP
jgi:murein DD-endopeptidase MepM/ murein hydrolase activator NlpD